MLDEEGDLEADEDQPEPTLPMRSDSIRPVIFGNQKYSAANMPKAAAPNAV